MLFAQQMQNSFFAVFPTVELWIFLLFNLCVGQTSGLCSVFFTWISRFVLSERDCCVEVKCMSWRGLVPAPDELLSDIETFLFSVSFRNALVTFSLCFFLKTLVSIWVSLNLFRRNHCSQHFLGKSSFLSLKLPLSICRFTGN